jgi:hypothetical protein
LALAAVGMLALLATQDYFEKARLTIETRATHTTRRNQIYQALSNRIKVCPPGGLPSSCVVQNACPLNLLAKNGGGISIPLSKLATLDPIRLDDRIELAVKVGTGGAPFIVSRTLGGAGAPAAQPTQSERQDRLQYDVLLTGSYRSQTAGGLRTYVGAVELIGHRNLIGRDDELRAQVPIEFTIDSGGALTDCVARTSERTITGGLNTIDQCLEAGGVTIPSDLGNLCRFRTPPPLPDLKVACPPGFIGDPAVACTLDPDDDATFLQTIPACPSIKDDAGATIAGVRDATMNRGNQYCNYQGTAAGPLVGECPPDPEWDATDPDSPPRFGWDEVTPSTFDPAVNLRKCKYDLQCDAPAIEIIPAAPIGDGKTPACQFTIEHCPNTDPVSYPSPWTEISTTPLKCRFNSYSGIPIPNAVCAPGFFPVDPATYPWISAWNNLPIDTSTVKKAGHIVCF